MANTHSFCLSYLTYSQTSFWTRILCNNLRNFWWTMKKRTFIIFVGYVWTKTLLGLVTEPHRSVQKVSRRTVLLPTLLSPLFALLGLFVVGRIGSHFFITQGLIRDIIAYVASTALISILLWQLLVLYLFFKCHNLKK